jgi:hypothetical protein
VGYYVNVWDVDASDPSLFEDVVFDWGRGYTLPTWKELGLADFWTEDNSGSDENDPVRFSAESWATVVRFHGNAICDGWRNVVAYGSFGYRLARLGLCAVSLGVMWILSLRTRWRVCLQFMLVTGFDVDLIDSSFSGGIIEGTSEAWDVDWFEEMWYSLNPWTPTYEIDYGRYGSSVWSLWY